MQDKSFIILNPEAYRFKKVKKHFDKNNIKYYVSYEKDYLIEIVTKKINEGIERFVLCGGDGTINRFINSVMKLPDKNKTIFIGIIPCGRANDLARYMNIPLEVENALKTLDKNEVKTIDLIKVNNSYLVTGGGIGLPTEIVKDSNRFSYFPLGKIIKKILGDLIYPLITLKKFILGYEGIELASKDGKKLLGIYILNQPFIGKRFNLAPEAKNDDGIFETKIVKNPPSLINNLVTMSKGMSGKLSELEWVKEKSSKGLSFSINKSSHFMGDGELLVKGDTFKIEIVPKVIPLIC
ncbi:hypothetical protein CL617_01055 [archaeon]|nr:hypothetical protein [archaeon]|tara:strand:- start:12287 stop:13171 length:885 start_codon:yes stop_codon:yes gene_type:complete